jgi:hypothetical protein
MSTTNYLISLIVNKNLPTQERIGAIKQLGVARVRKKEQPRAGGISHLASDDLPGQDELRHVIQDPRDQIEVRCQAAAVAAKTDSKSALDWCDGLIKQYLEF